MVVRTRQLDSDHPHPSTSNATRNLQHPLPHHIISFEKYNFKPRSLIHSALPLSKISNAQITSATPSIRFGNFDSNSTRTPVSESSLVSLDPSANAYTATPNINQNHSATTSINLISLWPLHPLSQAGQINIPSAS